MSQKGFDGGDVPAVVAASVAVGCWPSCAVATSLT